MFVARKRDGSIKARTVVGGNTQQDYLTNKDSSSPTVATKAVLLTSIADALEKRDVTVIDITNVFIKTRVGDVKDHVIMRVRGVIVDWLMNMASEYFGPRVTLDKKGEKILLVECLNAI